MTPRQKSIVQTTFTQITPITETVAELFYSRLFQLDPTVRLLFKSDMKEQSRKLMHMIGVAVRGLDHVEKIIPAVQDLGQRHASYGVKDEHYETVGEALLWTLGECLGVRFTVEVKEAWTTVYNVLTTTMQDAARSASAIIEKNRYEPETVTLSDETRD